MQSTPLLTLAFVCASGLALALAQDSEPAETVTDTVGGRGAGEPAEDSEVDVPEPVLKESP